MSKIEIISASAGSGKTHTLATLLEREIGEGRVRPDAVLATTFTNKAAAELKERTRRTLLAAGRFDDAQRLGAARIGTVNAVCGRIVADFAFELGLSPDVRVLDEAVSASSFREALSSVLSDTVTGTFEDLRSRMREFDGLAAARSVLDAARSNGLGTIELSACADRSVAGVLELFGTPVAGENLDGALVEALTTFVASVDTTVDTTQKTATALETAGSALADLRRGRHLLWSEWAKLAKLAPAQKSDALADPVRAAAAAQDRHPRLRADMETAIRTVFSVAGQALEVYQAHKRAWGVIDFADQEVLALGLLGRADVRAHVAGELDLVLVDEFQDTSPVQLAIFLRLSELAARSVWVGDQKQAIFGFRGADPSLMDAVIRAILGKTEPRTLPHSYRSRPELVRLTSDLFARAFPSQGIPAERVRLEPARLDEAPGLGVILERWTLDAKSTENDAHAVAAGVRLLLDDPTTRVREGKADARAVRAGDVAVLCRTNDGCAAVADALENLGIRAALPRAGLLSTPEAIATTAALRLFVDGRDSLAKAELSRFAEGDGDLDAWLARLLETPGAGALTKLDVVQRVLAARERSPGAGALEAFDLAVDAARVAELCRRWGDAEARLANLDRLRAHAVTYLSGASATGAAATPAGLIAWLGRLADDGEDAQAVRTGGGAVAVSTWHAAKGLEWPIVVLHGLNRFTGSPLGVSVARDIDGFDFAAPLAGRWVRFWPQPYAAKNNGLPFHTRLAAHPATEEAEAREARQELRVLYVGWTRARDRLVISTRAGALTKGLLELLQEGGVPLVSEPTPSATWAGRVVTATLRCPAPSNPVVRDSEPGAGFDAPGPAAHPPAFRRPSDFDHAGAVVAHTRLGPHLTLTGNPEMAALGEAVHGFLAADRAYFDPAQRHSLAEGLLGRWSVAGALPPKDLLDASDRLQGWVAQRWPDARWCREWPVAHPLEDGSGVRGFSDLVLDTEAGLVVVDHKSTPGREADVVEAAAGHAGQLGAYADAVSAATGRPVIGCFVHLPVAGVVVEVSRG